MSDESERLTPRYTERGLIQMPAISGRDGHAMIRESSLADAAAIWVTVGNRDARAACSVELTLDQAAGLRDQIDFLIKHHRMVVDAEIVEAEIVYEDAPEPAPVEQTWRPVRVNAVGEVLAIVDDHGERLTRQPATVCSMCGAETLFAGRTRTLCTSCGRHEPRR